MTSERTENASIDICDKKILSIIIPAYNTETYIDECIQSCVKQNLDSEKYEIIIINDGSTDRTLEIAERWAEKHRNIKVLSQENQGQSVARNAGLNVASGKYIMFVDSDDYLTADSIGALVERCQADNLDLLRFCAANITENNYNRRFAYNDIGVEAGKNMLKRNFQVGPPFSIYRKEFLDKHSLRFHPGVYHEDNEFTPKVYWYAEKAASINDIIYFVRLAPGSTTRTPNPKRGYDLLKVISLLEEFAQQNVSVEYRPYIYKQIADCINWCIRLTNTLKKDDAEKLLDHIYENRQIFDYMVRSNRITHRIEGRLLKLFPRRMKTIYNTLDLIHR